jgi:hypothetical protein
MAPANRPIIAIQRARQGGFTSVNLPGPLNLPPEEVETSFLFLPSKNGDTWQVTDGTNNYDLTFLDEEADEVPAEITLATSGGPYTNAPNLATNWIGSGPDGPKFMFYASDPAFSPQADSAGVTFEVYVDFGANGSVQEGISNGVVAQCFLATEQFAGAFGTFIIPPYVALDVFADASTETGGRLGGRLRPWDGSRFDEYELAMISGGTAAIDNIGWQHIAGEIYADGTFRLYRNGTMVMDETGDPLPAGFLQSLDTFIPCIHFSGRGRPTTKIHGSRYSPFIRYNGDSFTPPQF